MLIEITIEMRERSLFDKMKVSTKKTVAYSPWQEVACHMKWVNMQYEFSACIWQTMGSFCTAVPSRYSTHSVKNGRRYISTCTHRQQRKCVVKTWRFHFTEKWENLGQVWYCLHLALNIYKWSLNWKSCSGSHISSFTTDNKVVVTTSDPQIMPVTNIHVH